MEAEIDIQLPLVEFWPLAIVFATLFVLFLFKNIRRNRLAQLALCCGTVTAIYITFSAYANKISFNDNTLYITAGSHSKTFTTNNACLLLTELDKIKTFDLSHRAAGTSFSNYKGGSFTDDKNRKIFVLLTGQFQTASLYQFDEGLLLVENDPRVNKLLRSLCE